MNFLFSYVLFLFKTFTFFILFFFIIFLFFNIIRRKNQEQHQFSIISLNEYYESIKNKIIFSALSKYEKKIWKKNQKKSKKHKFSTMLKLIKKENNLNCTVREKRPILYVLDFKGSINAIEVESLRQEISAIILAFKKNDEVLIRLESGGGVVHGYGLAAAQLNRLREKNIHLTISVDKIAASGGYMMACVANYIIGTPFSVIGSIGVVAQIPNFYKFLKRNDIDVELHTAGKYKRTLTTFGKNTPEARDKFCLELNDTHKLFKEFVSNMRPSLNIEEVSNGEYWFGSIALQKGLIDKIETSDDFIMSKIKDFIILKIKYNHKKTFLSSFLFKMKCRIKNAIFKVLNI
ncbi:MAG: protease SohB [Buchnera aphidicola (Nurudea shiraii)]